MIKKFFVIALLILPYLTYAHPGHGSFDGISLSHFLTSPIHVIPILILGLIYVIWKVKNKHQQQS